MKKFGLTTGNMWLDSWWHFIPMSHDQLIVFKFFFILHGTQSSGMYFCPVEKGSYHLNIVLQEVVDNSNIYVKYFIHCYTTFKCILLCSSYFNKLHLLYFQVVGRPHHIIYLTKGTRSPCPSLPVISSHAVDRGSFACAYVQATAEEEAVTDDFTPQ